jgi:hypothetical protein
MRSGWIIIGSVISALALGCSEKHEDPDAEGCEHLKQGPAATPAPTAAATADAAPAVAADHQRYDVALIDVAGGKGGFVKYAASEAADYLFFLSADVPVEFLDGANATVAPEESATSSRACAEIRGRHLVPLEVGTYTLRLGPTTETSVSIVVEEAAHGH